jgi:hypothetical protein
MPRLTKRFESRQKGLAGVDTFELITISLPQTLQLQTIESSWPDVTLSRFLLLHLERENRRLSRRCGQPAQVEIFGIKVPSGILLGHKQKPPRPPRLLQIFPFHSGTTSLVSHRIHRPVLSIRLLASIGYEE